ncbi:Sec-independent protein translocase subunit TatA/TatB [Sulfolobus acidocaldarius]|uniref:Conserved Archaeal protein n=4 Tax=Sulfolobus acidocaldarius TaxID=2285 RepID=Q4JC06_SULAC|nr:twin-arginine translocase TatA/TatE family subunit [Sulfolobus acidocaldarius]AAY79673.1 conserved Archaeal protein [Sulfolobus acidocaldarius DSM 639]AGE70231.1 hypothetical protein SacN8_01250 [Sulfolobus acidocaldarius N8]AGE72506.1 hypothetical protein SacRon12I_01250 [Sulfolobus acidocaldarius Ron12/I]ALU29363.1 twin arginine-targeting protein translocase [Sulfolobus acidocaldarius]ALU32092.1 twin arginine-targeting protein translocase [Sulfolobus acidocaldarius]
MINMFGNWDQLLVVLIVAAILFFGATKLPELFRSLGKSVGEFKKGKMEAEMELMQMQQAQQAQQPVDKEAELQKKIQDLQRELEELKKQKQQSGQS